MRTKLPPLRSVDVRSSVPPTIQKILQIGDPLSKTDKKDKLLWDIRCGDLTMNTRGNPNLLLMDVGSATLGNVRDKNNLTKKHLM